MSPCTAPKADAVHAYAEPSVLLCEASPTLANIRGSPKQKAGPRGEEHSLDCRQIWITQITRHLHSHCNVPVCPTPRPSGLSVAHPHMYIASLSCDNHPNAIFLLPIVIQPSTWPRQQSSPVTDAIFFLPLTPPLLPVPQWRPHAISTNNPSRVQHAFARHCLASPMRPTSRPITSQALRTCKTTMALELHQDEPKETALLATKWPLVIGMPSANE